MTTVGLAEAKAKLSELVDRVERGEEVLIARYGRPVAQIIPLASKPKMSLLGAMKGKIRVAEDFDAPLSPEEVREWYEGPIEPGT